MRGRLCSGGYHSLAEGRSSGGKTVEVAKERLACLSDLVLLNILGYQGLVARDLKLKMET